MSCTPGKYSSGQGAQVCQDCSIGEYQNTTGATSCELCAPLTYGPVPGMSRCLRCGRYSYQNNRGQDQCLYCPEHEYLVNPHLGICKECPSSAICAVTSITSTANSFLRRDQATGELHSFPCLPGYCLDGSQCALTSSSGVNNFTSQTLQSETDSSDMEVLACCNAHRPPAPSNQLCGRCDPDYVDWRGDCVYCVEPNAGRIVLVLLLAIGFVIYFYRSSQSPEARTRIVILFIQMCLLFLDNIYISWLSFVSFNFMDSAAGSCIAPMSPMFQLLTGLWTPFVCVAILWLIFAIRRLGIACCHNKYTVVEPITIAEPSPDNSSSKDDRDTSETSPSGSTAISASSSYPALDSFVSPGFSCSRFCESKSKCGYLYSTVIFDRHLFDKNIRATIALLLFSYNSILSTCFRFVDCIELSPNESYVTSAPAISCQSSEYRTFYPMIVVVLVVVVGFLPVLLLFVSYRIRSHLREPTTLLRYGVLYVSSFHSSSSSFQFSRLVSPFLSICLL
jgi:hypothetical protein